MEALTPIELVMAVFGAMHMADGVCRTMPSQALMDKLVGELWREEEIEVAAAVLSVMAARAAGDQAGVAGALMERATERGYAWFLKSCPGSAEELERIVRDFGAGWRGSEAMLRKEEGGKYKLEGHEPVLVEDLAEWARWFEAADRVVAQDFVDDAEVATYFLGLDVQMHEGGRPLLFETQIISPWDVYNRLGRRYSSWDEAAAGHALVVEAVRKVGRVVAEGNGET